MGYDTWKLRSDMDAADQSRPVNRWGREPVSKTCAGPCEPCATIDKVMAVSTQTLNGQRCCENHFVCERCDELFHTDDAHGQMCGDCYRSQPDVLAEMAAEQKFDESREN